MMGQSVCRAEDHDWYFDMGPNYAGWWCSRCGIAIHGLDHPNERKGSACAH